MSNDRMLVENLLESVIQALQVYLEDVDLTKCSNNTV